jgi:hypothetical protein
MFKPSGGASNHTCLPTGKVETIFAKLWASKLNSLLSWMKFVPSRNLDRSLILSKILPKMIYSLLEPHIIKVAASVTFAFEASTSLRSRKYATSPP